MSSMNIDDEEKTELEQQQRQEQQQDEKVSLASLYRRVRKIGSGDIGTVYLVKSVESGDLFAMKIFSKTEMRCRQRFRRCLTERDVLDHVHHPFVVALHHEYTTANHIMFVMDYCRGGEFYKFLQSQPGHCICESWVRFYSSEILVALQYLHLKRIVHRDLKPENILIHGSGHIMLTDFDLAAHQSADRAGSGAGAGVVHTAERIPLGTKIRRLFSRRGQSWGNNDNMTDGGDAGTVVASYVREEEWEPNFSRTSFVGTPEYLCPEILKGRPYVTSAIDWWTFGVLLYEMTFGVTPFHAPTESATFANISNSKKGFHVPKNGNASKNLQSLIRKLLRANPEKRLRIQIRSV